MPVRICLAALVAALPLAAPAAQADKAGPPSAQERLAVLEFSGKADPGLLAQLADEVRGVAAAELRGRYIVMTREAMVVLVKEMGGTCTEGDCEVETARNVGAALVATGEVRTIGKALVLGLKLHETARGALLGAETVRADDPLALLDRCRAAAQTLLRSGLGGGAMPAPGAPARPPAGGVAGTFEEANPYAVDAGAEEVPVSFESEPAGAIVRVDGQLLCAQTPCRKRIAAGPHEATFEKERYTASAQRFGAAKDATVRATLAPRFGWISVETVPPGVGISIDGADAGKSPVTSHEADQGTIEVAIADPCWLRSGERVALKAGERRTVKLAAKPRLAGLKVNAEDEEGNAVDAVVSVDGVAAGAAGEILRVPLCAKKVAVPLGGTTFEADLRLDDAKIATIAAKPGGRRDGDEEMVLLSGGTFDIDAGHVLGAKKEVTVAQFFLDEREVTVAKYDLCIAAGKCTAPGSREYWCNEGKADRRDHPVNCVDFNQATAYCAWVGKRLPTEEEWEWAARGGARGTMYPWGNEPPRRQLCWNGKGNDAGNGKRQTTCRVGAYPRGDSPEGLKDLAGNVAEWTASPRKTSWGALHRVYRGGAWTSRFIPNVGDEVAASYRDSGEEDTRLNSLGFRCAKTP
jgi:formylglycine-generating enzyme required for sulfatase activity